VPATLQQYRARLAEAVGFHIVTTTTAGAAQADQVIVADFRSSELEPTFFGNTWCYQPTGPNAGQVRRIVYQTGLDPTSGTISLEAPFGTNTPTGTVLEIHGVLPAISREGRLGLNDIVNRVLAECWTVQRVGTPVVQDQVIYPLSSVPFLQWEDQVVDVYWQPPLTGVSAPPPNGASQYDQLIPTWTFRSGGDSPSIQIACPLQPGGVFKPEFFIPLSWWCNQGGAWPGPLEGLHADTDQALLSLQGMEVIGLAWVYGEMAKFGLPDDQSNYRQLQTRARAAANEWKRLALERPVGRRYHWPESMIVPSRGNYSYQNGYPWGP
jgi:hypothetical protein